MQEKFFNSMNVLAENTIFPPYFTSIFLKHQDILHYQVFFSKILLIKNLLTFRVFVDPKYR